MKLDYASLEMVYTPLKSDVWEAQKGKEVRFWDGWLEKHAEEYNKPKPLDEHLNALVGNGARAVADIGSGACCLIGGDNTAASDVLAREYMDIWRRLGIRPVIPIDLQDATCLTYTDNSFDLVHCANTLDHSRDPRGAITEMARVCKTGGVVYLMHLIDQGRCSHYTGLHQWNVTADGYIWRRAPAKDNERGRWSAESVVGFRITDCLPGAKVVRGDRWSRVIVTWRKP